jgi:hypothetical protein
MRYRVSRENRVAKALMGRVVRAWSSIESHHILL